MANTVEMLSGKKKKDYAAESAAQALEAQAAAMGMSPDRRLVYNSATAFEPDADDDDESEDGTADEELVAA